MQAVVEGLFHVHLQTAMLVRTQPAAHVCPLRTVQDVDSSRAHSQPKHMLCRRDVDDGLLVCLVLYLWCYNRDLSRPQSFTYNMLRKTSISENIRQVMGFRLLASRMFPLRGSYAANPGIFPLRRSPWKSKLPATGACDSLFGIGWHVL